MSELVKIGNPQLEVTVARLGAEMQSVNASGVDVLWHGDADYWAGRAPLLFPIVGPAPDGVVTIGTFTSQMGNHGFARRSKFTLVDSGPEHCVHELTDTADSHAQFPFAFRLRVTHRVDGNTLLEEVEVTNSDTSDMPFGFGFHPAFPWPLPGAEGKAHRVSLSNGAAPQMARLVGDRLGSARLPSPFSDGQLTLDPSMFSADAMIFPEGAGTALTLSAEGGPRLDFEFENLPNLAIWSKPTGAPFVCIEPWHGMHAAEGSSDALAERPYSNSLAPGEAKRFAYRLKVSL